jgi:hypothetical protein
MQTEERIAESAAPSCNQCIFGPINDTGKGPCDHIAHWERRRDFVQGKWVARNEVTTDEARGEDGLCGPEGLLFQPYSFGARIARHLARANLFHVFLGLVSAVGLSVALITGQ